MNENNDKRINAPDDQDAALNFLNGTGRPRSSSTGSPQANQRTQSGPNASGGASARANVNQPRKEPAKNTLNSRNTVPTQPHGQTGSNNTAKRPLHSLQGTQKTAPQQPPYVQQQSSVKAQGANKNGQAVVPLTRKPGTAPTGAAQQNPQGPTPTNGQKQNSGVRISPQNKVASPAQNAPAAVQRGQSATAAQKHSASAKAGDVQVYSGRRSENDDFEIDEATYEKDSRRDGPFADSATSAVMSLVKAVIYIVAVIAVAVGLSIFAINTGNDIFKFAVEEKIVTVTIPEYATIDDITDALYDAGAIKYKWAFKMWSNLKTKGKTLEFAAGTYEISTTLNYDYLRMAFRKNTGSYEEVRITIPEGYTVDEIIELFVSKGIGTKEGFVDVIQNYEFDYKFLEGLEVSPDRIYRLEGYLFPDTYNFYKDSSEVTVIKKLLDNFNRKFVEAYYARCEQLGMTVDEAIILASMVEKETRYADELGYVSSVFHNRLKYSATYPYLNSDATIMYAMQHDLGGRPDSMAGEDTAYETAYNTYTHKGLPPGPIANPGLNSIKYALYPNESDYFFFVSDSSGRTLFAKTEKEHLANINTVRGN